MIPALSTIVGLYVMFRAIEIPLSSQHPDKTVRAVLWLLGIGLWVFVGFNLLDIITSATSSTSDLGL